jgi:soluble lytic murein transglycosylase-like protein
MAIPDPSVPRDRRSAPSRWALATVGVAAFTLVAIVSVVESYVAFKYPIKWDRYRHAFSEHVVDRAIAYALLLQSPFRWRNAGMSAESIQTLVEEVGEKHGVDLCLVAAVVTFESGLNPNTITTTGAMGLMALQPATARLLGVQDPFDPRQNIDGGTRMLRDLLTSFGGDPRLALAGYNAGPGAVKKYGGVPPFRETRDYVSHVGTIYDLCRAHPQSFLPMSRGLMSD